MEQSLKACIQKLLVPMFLTGFGYRSMCALIPKSGMSFQLSITPVHYFLESWEFSQPHASMHGAPVKARLPGAVDVLAWSCTRCGMSGDWKAIDLDQLKFGPALAI